MPLLARLGNRASLLLHHFVYSFPSRQPAHPHTDDATDGLPTIRASDYEDSGENEALQESMGPLSFAGSGYGITLILMMILLNRIHHIVRRPRQTPVIQPSQGGSRYQQLRRRVQIALTHPDTPLYIRVPGVIALLRSWFLFTIVLLQVGGYWPNVEQPGKTAIWRSAVGGVGRWAGNMEMEVVCWQVFVGVCIGLVCSGIANGLDTVRRRDVAAGFNLFGYSFLLHLYSSPFTHKRTPGPHSQGRPDVHALFQMWLSLGELTWLQTFELSRTMRSNVLLPTSVCGILGLGHFIYVLARAPLRFPSFTFLTHMVSPSWSFLALFLSVIIVFTAVLKAITLLFTVGKIPSLGALFPHEGVVPQREDDFGVALLKIGTACIEATALTGLRNELAAVDEPRAPWVEIMTSGSDFHRAMLRGIDTPGFSTEITDIKVSEIEDPNSDASPHSRALAKFVKTCRNAILSSAIALLLSTRFGRKALRVYKKAWRARWYYGPRSWRFWRRESWTEPPQYAELRRVRERLDENDQARRELRSMVTMLDTCKEQVKGDEAIRARATGANVRPGGSSVERRGAGKSEMMPYGQYLLEDVEDEIEDDGEWTQQVEESDDESETASQATNSEWGEDDSGDETEVEESRKGAIYRDLIITELEDDDESHAELQPVLLAHLTSRNGTPLTRRQYSALFNNPTSPTRGGRGPEMSYEGAMSFRGVAAERREMMDGKRDEEEQETRMACVVCMVSTRDTILWPCRCLALCNDCRESLASRLTADDQMCPCCRKKVEGYSRIYIP
ncbi:hypothetical protein L202_00478 [Cryptococcus amylolentus CBS 6039]|uniref:RING-type domain-containing protein n=2 Tax=Cryptococcus amylolentus CBS 6039 TaxID=1295533 RepID=A0A1E3I7S6_9TREE|nr:hypothetical protein L202_00478 [Cryptococcus amylolentus CBS 6039]ODN84548.1 hypothetical protein L202_00478 [Cryptococcus amylolentus CBS 6039]